jgi:hypothetical protein
LSAAAGGWPSGLAVAPKVASAPRGPGPVRFAGNPVQSRPRAAGFKFAKKKWAPDCSDAHENECSTFLIL